MATCNPTKYTLNKITQNTIQNGCIYKHWCAVLYEAYFLLKMNIGRDKLIILWHFRYRHLHSKYYSPCYPSLVKKGRGPSPPWDREWPRTGPGPRSGSWTRGWSAVVTIGSWSRPGPTSSWSGPRARPWPCIGPRSWVWSQGTGSWTGVWSRPGMWRTRPTRDWILNFLSVFVCILYTHKHANVLTTECDHPKITAHFALKGSISLRWQKWGSGGSDTLSTVVYEIWQSKTCLLINIFLSFVLRINPIHLNITLWFWEVSSI